MPEKLMITVDSRELRSGVTKHLEARNVIGFEVNELHVGDYLLSDDVIVERKAAIDFVTSLMEGRLHGQIQQMKATYAKAIVLIEGDVFATRSAITPEALQGALSWLALIACVGVVHSRNTAETASLLETMTRHAQLGLGYELPMRGGKPKDLMILSQYIVEGLPGCGPGTAKKLLSHFGTAENVLCASGEQLCEVKGVGKKTADLIRAAATFRA